MKRWCVAVLALLTFSPLVYAGDEFDRQLDEARRQVDEAAKVLGELYRQKYDLQVGEKKAMLGIMLGDKPSQGGVELFGVTPGGGAEEAGLEAGDVIVKLNDLSLSGVDSPMKSLSGYMKDVAPGDEVSVVFERDGEREEVQLTTQARTAHMLSMIGDKLDSMDLDIDIDLDHLRDMPEVHHAVLAHDGVGSRKLMLVSGDLAEYFDVEAGVVIVEPPVDSRLKAGDVLLSVAGMDVVDLAEARALLSDIEDEAQVQVKRHGKRQTLAVSEQEFADLGAMSETRVIRIEKPGAGEEHVVIKVEVTD